MQPLANSRPKNILRCMISFLRWLFSPRYRLFKFLLAMGLLLLLFWLASRIQRFIHDWDGARSQELQTTEQEPLKSEDLLTVQRDTCPGAPFILPSDGTIGLLYADPRGPYSPDNPHQGIDIFSYADPGIVPVYAAYDGYVRREADWKSTLIMRVPDDPLQSGRQLWLYYTHMADEAGNDFIIDAFPPGTSEKYVEQGTLLGYTGNYSGSSLRDVWVHLHFSIVQDNGNGIYSNELDFDNTVDPSEYLGIAVNYHCGQEISGCTPDPSCTSTTNGS